MEAFFVSTLAVTIGEIGDKTQLLAFILATRFRKAVPIVLGILVATLANHAIAGLAGNWIREMLEPETLRWGLGASFLGIAAWAIKPDELDEDDAACRMGTYGVFMCSLVAFFLAEIGDKTQIATVVLALEYQAVAMVVVGTTIGMLAANVPAVLAGHLTADRLPLRAIRVIAATVFVALGAFAYFTGAAPSPLPAPTQLE